MDSYHNKTEYRRLISLLKEALAKDYDLRQQFAIEHKFEFIPKQLESMIHELEAKLVELENQDAQKNLSPVRREPGADETIVYVYLFHGGGKDIVQWQQMLLESSLANYAVSRPIYEKRADVERLIRARKDVLQHAFLAVIVKNSDIVRSADEGFNLDPIGQPLVRIKENSLKFENIVCFVHHGLEYHVTPEGELVKVSS